MNRPADPAQVLVLVGPTASGKSSVALALAQRIGAEIVNADSRQIYRHLDAATAKPSPEDRALVPHHLYDFLDPKHPYSAGEYRRDAAKAIGAILMRRKVPLVVGGTGLYLRALFRGLSPLPPRDAAVRDRLLEEAEKVGREALHRRLESVDPEAARKIPAGNLQRVVRALEVHELTGKPLSEFHAESPGSALGLSARFFGLRWDREALKERIRRRTLAIVPALIEESRRLESMGYGEKDPGLEGIGYREALRLLKGGMTRDELFAAVLKGTLAYAKRQTTWFRADPDIEWVPMAEPFDAKAAAAELERRWSRPN